MWEFWRAEFWETPWSRNWLAAGFDAKKTPLDLHMEEMARDPDTHWFVRAVVEYRWVWETLSYWNQFLLIGLPIFCFATGIWSYMTDDEKNAMAENAVKRAAETSKMLNALDDDVQDRAKSKKKKGRKKQR